ncbi:glutathione S-transferase family protein [Spongiibacter taiwanensis]|uniref:glutathione S-transferase family protein n=1 Tax=Spongiibacter taiwanensis TaxID=1748242 RepID=UPI002034DF75|nr:glutathione S-transferase family protein [Spongiibacter taiwanensis]USA42883.1 glutathione S-transferase family protein [Spongiibacter taiwanensis]
MITVYGLPRSRSTRVLWALEECNQAYTFMPLNFAEGQQRTDHYLSLNPGAKVPTLVDGDLVLTESGAIVNYVANRYGDHLAPSTPADRAHYDRWCYFALTELEQPLWTMGKHRFALPAEQRVAAIMPTATWEHQKALNLFSQGLDDKPYILGDQFSGADILLGHTLMWGIAFKQPLEQANLQAYLDRIAQRPALQRAQAAEAAG